jgi:ATP-dependent Clp protease adaptor protein ClpS
MRNGLEKARCFGTGPFCILPAIRRNFRWKPQAHFAIANTPRLSAKLAVMDVRMRDDNDGGDDQGNNGTGNGTGVVTKTRTKTKKPSLYKVLILNDDYTPMEFVVHILERFFNKNREEAVQVMLHVHRHGVGICGVFTYEIAETKVAQVIEFSRRHQHPLQCTMEKE